MKHFSKFLIVALAVIALTYSLTQSAFAQEQREMYLQANSYIYREAKVGADILGTYRKGLKIKVFFPDRNGFYAIYYGKPFKGAKYGWISAQNVGPSPPDSAPSNSSSEENKNELSFGLNFGSFSPSAFQTTLGESPSSIGEVGIHFSYLRKITTRFFAEMRYDYYSFTNGLLNSANPSSDFYYANGDMFGLLVGYVFLHPRTFCGFRNLRARPFV